MLLLFLSPADKKRQTEKQKSFNNMLTKDNAYDSIKL